MTIMRRNYRGVFPVSAGGAVWHAMLSADGAVRALKDASRRRKGVVTPVSQSRRMRLAGQRAASGDVSSGIWLMNESTLKTVWEI